MRGIKLHGFQAGPDGFVSVGTGGPGRLEEWEEGLNLLVAGGRNSGKTVASAIRAVNYCLNWPGAYGLVMAPTLEMFERATLPVFAEVAGWFGLERGKDWQWAVTKHMIDFDRRVGGAKIAFLSGEEPARSRGPNASFGWWDESAFCSYEAYLQMRAAIRRPGYPHQMWQDTTPQGKDNWVYGLFYPGGYELGDGQIQAGGAPTAEERVRLAEILGEDLDWGTEEQWAGGRYLAYKALTAENPHGGKEYFLQMYRLYGGVDHPYCRQELFGEFVYRQGLVYDTFHEGEHVVPESRWPGQPTRFVAGVDFGFAHRAAIVVVGVDSEGREYWVEEFSKAGVSQQQLAEVALGLQKKYRIRVFFCDTEDPQSIAYLRAAGVRVVPANKRRQESAGDYASGIGQVTFAINRRHPVTGERMLFCSPSCRELRRELAHYVRVTVKDLTKKEVPEKPLQVGDDCVDALRYAQMGLVRLRWLPDIVAIKAGQQGGFIPTRRVA